MYLLFWNLWWSKNYKHFWNKDILNLKKELGWDRPPPILGHSNPGLCRWDLLPLQTNFEKLWWVYVCLLVRMRNAVVWIRESLMHFAKEKRERDGRLLHAPWTSMNVLYAWSSELWYLSIVHFLDFVFWNLESSMLQKINFWSQYWK